MLRFVAWVEGFDRFDQRKGERDVTNLSPRSGGNGTKVVWWGSEPPYLMGSLCMVTHIAKVWINRARLSILLVVS